MNAKLSFPKSKIKILLLENIHQVAAEKLSEEGFHVDRFTQAYTEAELLAVVDQYHLIGIRSKTHLTTPVLKAATRLLSVGAFCIGTDQIEGETACSLGVPVFNAPYSNTRSVAELVLAEMICLARQLFDRSSSAHRGEWLKSADGSREVRGKVLGIVGYGHIGSQLSVLAEALGLKVIFYDVVKKLPLGNAQQKESLDEVLKNSDFVTLHVPDTQQTRGMIRARELQTMKAGSFLINASRGKVVDLDALKDSLLKKQIAGAAVDVFPKEPAHNKEKFESPIQGLSNVILTPHIGGSTEEAQEAIGREVADSFIRFINNGSTSGAVNFPKVDLPVQEDVHRILNVHKNVPGVLSDINKIVSDAGANIRGQYLSTNQHIGYLVMDLEKAEADVVAEEIRKLGTSIRTRMLY